MIDFHNFPAVPDSLIPSVESFSNSTFSGTTTDYQWYTGEYNDLTQWLADNLPFEHTVAFHTLVDGVPVHKDIARTKCYNYIIHAGGDAVSTDFYNDDRELIESYVIPERTWHSMPVDVFHGVSNIETKRYAITLTPVDSVIADPKDYNYDKFTV